MTNELSYADQSELERKRAETADVQALVALVNLDAACQYAEARAEGSFQVDPRNTEAAIALRKLLAVRGVL